MGTVQVHVHDYGLRIQLQGKLIRPDATALRRDIGNMIGTFDEPFGLLVDRREVTVVMQEAVQTLTDEPSARVQQLRRAVIVYDSRVSEPQFARSELIDVVSARLFYMDAAHEPDWEVKATCLLREAATSSVDEKHSGFR